MKPDSITPELFAKLVTLAALELTPEESEYLRTELNHQLAAVQELSEIQLAEGVRPVCTAWNAGAALRAPTRGFRFKPS